MIVGVGEISFADYNRKLVSKKLVKAQMEDDEFDDQQYIYTLDVSVIATGFAQLVDEGLIEKANKEIIQVAINRQKLWPELSDGWEYAKQYIANLIVLERALKSA